MLVVADSSPLIALAQITHIQLLPQLFGKVVVPNAVWSELSVLRAQHERNQLLSAEWLQPAILVNPVFPIGEYRVLNAGEYESINLALQLKADVLLIDERLGRQIASTYGVRVIGTAGLLGIAKRAGLIQRVKPLLYELVESHNFRLSQATIEHILRDVDEASGEP